MTKKEELEAQGYKTYENEDIQVFWKPRICQHAGECARGNYNVFNPQRRPWIDLSQAPATEIADIIDRCPSGGGGWNFDEVIDRSGTWSSISDALEASGWLSSRHRMICRNNTL